MRSVALLHPDPPSEDQSGSFLSEHEPSTQNKMAVALMYLGSTVRFEKWNPGNAGTQLQMQESGSYFSEYFYSSIQVLPLDGEF